MTSKSFSPRDEWRIFADDSFWAADIEDAKAKLQERYGKSAWQHKKPMFLDTKASPDDPGYSKTIQCGWIVGFRNADYSHAPVERWLQQDWIALNQEKAIDVSDAA